MMYKPRGRFAVILPLPEEEHISEGGLIVKEKLRLKRGQVIEVSAQMNEHLLPDEQLKPDDIVLYEPERAFRVSHGDELLIPESSLVVKCSTE